MYAARASEAESIAPVLAVSWSVVVRISPATAVLAARTSVGVHPASSCRDRSIVPVVKYIACAPNRIFRASGGLYRASACCGCGDSSSCAVSAASVVVYIATLLAEFWELA